MGMTNLDSILKKQGHHFADKGPYSQSYGFSSSHVRMWELDHKEGWALKNQCFWTVVLEKTLESPLDCKEIEPVNLTGNQLWVFTGRTDAAAEAPILWPPDAKSWLIGKDPEAGKDWRQEEKGVTEGEMVGWHHWLNGHEFEQTLGDGKGQGSLACCSPWGHKESNTTYWLNCNNLLSRWWCCCWLVITCWIAWRCSKASFVKICVYLAVMGLSCSIKIFDFHCGMWDLVPWPGIEPEAPRLGAQNLSRWTTREVPLKHLNALHHVPANSCGRPGELE